MRAGWLGALVAFTVVACGGASETNPPRTTTAAAAGWASAPAHERSSSDASDDEVVAGMQQSFRECYQIGLWNNPRQSGTVELVLKLDPRGRPASVTPLGGTGLDRMVLDCLVRVAGRGSFAPPTGDGNVIVPLKFRSDRALDAGAHPAASRSSARD